MLRQLLTFVLAGILVLETPATAYAAGHSMNAAVPGDAASQYETSVMSEAAEGLTDVSGSESVGGGEITLLVRQMRTPTVP